MVQRRNAAGGCGGLAPCAGESLRGETPSHVAGPEERFLFRIIQSYTKRSARTDQGQTLAGAPVQAGGQFRRSAFCIRSNYTVGAPAAISRRIGPRVIKSARAGNAVAVAPARLCGTGGRSASPAGVDVGTGGRLRPAARPGRLWGVFCFWQLPAIVAAAGRCRSRRCSGNVDRTGTESGHMAGTSAGAVRGVHCRPQVLTVFRRCAVVELLPALFVCRLFSLMVVEWCCGGLPPPGKGPSPAVWGEGLYRLVPGRRRPTALAGVRSSRNSLATRSWHYELQGPEGPEGAKESLRTAPVRLCIAGWTENCNGGLCGDI